MPGPTPFTDYVAGDRIATLREDRGLSREGLAKALRLHAEANGWLKPGGIGAVSAETVKAIEEGHLPSERVRLALALFFGVDRRSIWDARNQREVPREPVAA